MMRHLKGWGIIILMLFTFLIYIAESKNRYTYTVFEVENGFAYRIKKGDKIMIEQAFIPTYDGHQPFAKASQAQEAAKLVIKKLDNNRVPALTIGEINTIIQTKIEIPSKTFQVE